MTTGIKLATTGIGISGVAVGAGFGIHHLTKSPIVEEKQQSAPTTPISNNKSIKEWLKSDGNKAIIIDDNSKSGVWDGKWKAFKEAHASKAPVGNWKIEGWETKKDTADGLTAFKKLCKDNSEKQVDKKEAELVKEVIKHCVEGS